MKQTFLFLSILISNFIRTNGQGSLSLDVTDIGVPSVHQPGGQNGYLSEGVDLSTGVITPKIHLTELESPSGHIVNVDLLYASGQGVHVSDIAGRVGLGWKVITGGTLIRSVKGIRDDKEAYFTEYWPYEGDPRCRMAFKLLLEFDV